MKLSQHHVIATVIGRLAFIVTALFLVLQSDLALATTMRKIKFWAVANSVEDIQMYRKLSEDFHQKTAIGVEITPLGWGDYSQKYLTAMAAGVAPDVGIAGLTSPLEWGSVGGIIAFDQVFPEETTKITSSLLPGMLDQFKFRGKIYGLPTDLVTMLVYFRPDILQKITVKPPQLWSELTHAIQKIEQNNYRFYLGWTKAEQWALSYYYMPFGFKGPRYEDGNPFLEWRDPGYQDAIRFALELWYLHGELGLLPPDRQIARFLSNIPDESLPLMVDGNWLVPMIHEQAKKTGTKWAAIPWPKADTGHHHNLMGGTAYVIFRDSRFKKEAMEWLTFLYSTEVQQKMLLDRIKRSSQTANFNISPNKALWESEQTPFWQRLEFTPYQNVISALKKIAWTFHSVERPLGLKEISHLEDQVLDRMRTFILNTLDGQAKTHNMPIWDYIKNTAKGHYTPEKKHLESSIKSRLREEYEDVYDQAISHLNHEAKSHQEQFGSDAILGKKIKSRANILTILEYACFILILFGLILVTSNGRLRTHFAAYAMIATPTVLAFIFVVVPMLTAFYLSFTDYHAILPLNEAKWVGFKHYLASFHLSNSDNVLESLKKTLMYIGICLPIVIGLSLVFAFLLNHNLIGQRVWRFLYFSPLVTSSVAVSLIFAQIYVESKSGWLNSALLQLGIIDNPLLLLRDEKTFLYCVIGLAVWHGLAFTILIFLAGLQQIPSVLYRAAEVDGAGFWRKFWHITIPGLRPQIAFVIMMSIIGGFQVFEPIYMMGGGSGYVGSKFGPNDAGKTMVPLVFDLGFERFRLGQASAVAYILFAIIFLVTLAQLKILHRYGKGEA